MNILDIARWQTSYLICWLVWQLTRSSLKTFYKPSKLMANRTGQIAFPATDSPVNEQVLGPVPSAFAARSGVTY